MSKSTFSDGIAAGVPKEVVVAQKYGEYIEVGPYSTISSIELSNCGIVYAKHYPYELCAMVKGRGSTPEDEKRFILILKDISRMVYHYIDAGT